MSHRYGRNRTIFDELRAIAYREMAAHKRHGSGSEAWRERLERIAIGINQQFNAPLSFGETRGIAKSVAKWTWRRLDAAQFSAAQSHRGVLSGNSRREASASLRDQQRVLISDAVKQGDGRSAPRIASLGLGVALRTAQRRFATPRSQFLSKSMSATRPWEAEGVSRATWYRAKAAS